MRQRNTVMDGSQAGTDSTGIISGGFRKGDLDSSDEEHGNAPRPSPSHSIETPGVGGKRLSVRADPFAERESKCLTWSDINMVLAPKRSEDEPTKLLNGVWGGVPAKKIVAIAGPSGAGKTSLLNILAGRQKTAGPITVSGDIRLNNTEIKPTKMRYRKQVAFVAQDDSLTISATPRECIRFSAKLRLSRHTTEEELDDLTERTLSELGLQGCANTIVGGALLKGISGGERKRTSVGVELVTKPSCVFLDEPTSGLDSFSAQQLVQVLKKVANAGASVLFTIHQPSSEVFELFDHFILMNKGRIMYQGPTNEVESYFGDRGHPIPPRYNPADFVMSVAQLYTPEQLEKDGFFPKDERNLLPATPMKADDFDDDVVRVSIATEIKMLFLREFRNVKRNRHPLVVRFSLATFLGCLVGTLFFRVGTLDNSIPKNFQSHFGGIMIVLMMTMFGSAMPSLLTFPSERPVFLREYSTNHYSVVSYFASRLCVEGLTTLTQVTILTGITYNMIMMQLHYYQFLLLAFTLAMTSTAVAVMLGSFVEKPEMAIEMLPLLFVPQFLFAGFFVATDLIPPAIRWAQYLCSMLYAIRLALVYEFGTCDAMTCISLLNGNNVNPNHTWIYWLILATLFATFRSLALIFLRRKATKFL